VSLLSSLFKTKKVNLTPDVTPLMPHQINPEIYRTLSDLSKQYIKGPGYGDDFINKATSPAIANLENSFRTRTMPFLSSELSKRGVSRSIGPGLASDVLGRAEHQKNLDVNELISKFQVLNEQQKKSDVQFGSNLGQNILSGDVNAQQRQAEASERLAKATAADARGREATDRGLAGGILQSGAQLAVPFLGGLSSLTSFSPAISGFLSKAQGGVREFNTASTKTLNSLTSSQLRDMTLEDLKSLLGE